MRPPPFRRRRAGRGAGAVFLAVICLLETIMIVVWLLPGARPAPRRSADRPLPSLAAQSPGVFSI